MKKTMTNNNKFIRLQKALGLNNEQMANWLGQTPLTITRWRNNTQEPSDAVIIALSYRLKYGSDYEVELPEVAPEDVGRITKAKVLNAVSEWLSVNRDYIDLEYVPSEGCYYWRGQAGAIFTDSMTFTRLGAVPVARWVEDFKVRMEAELSDSLFSTFDELVESLDWRVEYE